MQIPLSAASISSLSPFLPRWPVAHKPLSEVTLWSGQTRLHAHIPECQKHVCWLLPHPLSARTSHLPPPVAGHGRAGTKASVSMWAEPLIWAKPQLWQRSVFLQCQFFFAARGPAAASTGSGMLGPEQLFSCLLSASCSLTVITRCLHSIHALVRA